MRCVSLRSGAGSVPERWYEFITIARLHFGDWYRGQLREVMVKGCQVWKRPATRVLKESPEWWCSKTWRLAHSLAGVMSLLLCLSLQWPAVVSSEIFFNEGSASGVPPWPSKAEVGGCSAQENAASLKDFLHRKMFWRWAYACLGGRKVINRWQTVSDIWHYLFFFRPVFSLSLSYTLSFVFSSADVLHRTISHCKFPFCFILIKYWSKLIRYISLRLFQSQKNK